MSGHGAAEGFSAGAAVVNSSLSIANSVTGVAISALESSLQLGDNLWRGVDVLDIVATRCDGQLAMSSPEVLEHWLSASQVDVVSPCLLRAVHPQMVQSSAAVAPEIPAVQSERQELNVLRSYCTAFVEIGAKLLATGLVQVLFTLINISFEVAWSNPLWGGLDLPLQSEHGQIL